VVSRIYDETAGQPNLIQYYCLILLRQLDFTGEREIGPETLFSVYEDEGFRAHLLTSFMQNTENRDKALVYALLAAFPDEPHMGFTQEVMDEALRKGGVTLLQDDIDEACNVLTLAGVIHRKGREYFFASPVFTKVLVRLMTWITCSAKLRRKGYEQTGGGGILDRASFDVLPDTAPSTARFHPAEMEQILQCVEEGVYCAVLGPRLCGKTELLLYVEQILTERLDGYAFILIWRSCVHPACRIFSPS